MLGDQLRALRAQRGWTQGDLAGKSGIAQKYVSALERGQRTNPSREVIQNLADALGVPVATLAAAAWADLPPEVAALQAAGVPDKDLQELAAKWEGLTEEDRDLLLTVTRSMWERRQARAAGRSQHNAGNPSQPATD